MASQYPINVLTQLPTEGGYILHEKSVLAYWKQIDAYKRVQEHQETSTDVFELLDGPPFVSSSNLHAGHLSVGDMKDTVLRFHSMHGRRNLTGLGFDCHGEPSEKYSMKKLDLKTCDDIEKYGISNFNGFCKNMVNECATSWQPVYDAMGRWCDFKNSYFTMDRNYMESVWNSFSVLNKKGLIYNGFKVMAYSPSIEMQLSDSEASQNYKTKKTNSVYVAFKVVNMSQTYFVGWSSTPWTLLSNVALCVNPNMKYVTCEVENGNKYIVSENSVENLKLDIKTVTDFGLGSTLVGMEYEPLFDYMEFKYHKVVADNYVKDSDVGTGIVHESPAHGADDFRVCTENQICDSKNLDQLCLVNSQGKYKPNTGEYTGMYVFDADKKIIKDLKLKGLLIRVFEYSHEYPYCYRSDTPLIYMAMSSYFVEVTKLKDRMIELNEKITWTKKELGENRFKSWLENARDWSISRRRYFGTPIPVWESDDKTESVVVGSIQELVELAELDYTPTDLHLEFVEGITIKSKETGNILKLNRSVFDCWYESSNVFTGQIHYPFENANYFDDKEYLSDFVLEGADQIRNWFYVLLVMSTALLDKPAFKTVLCSGIILDEHGEKISKSKGNFEDPMVLINEFGADTMRLLCQKSPLVNGDSLSFKKSDAKELSQRLTPYVNAVKFFLEHYINSQKKADPVVIEYLASSDDYDTNGYTLMDLWILEKVYLLRVLVEQSMELYKLDVAVKAIIDFVDDLANWYLKFNRDRMKGLCGREQSERSLSTMFTVLFDYCIVSAPFMPFLSEHIYQYLGALLPDDKFSTVHLEGYPDSERKHNIEESFSRLQKLAKLIRYARDTSKSHLSVRIPIKSCTVYHHDQDYLNGVEQLMSLIEDEVNCQNFEYVRISADTDMLTYAIKPNFKVIGQTYKKQAKVIVDKLTNLDQHALKNLYIQPESTADIEIDSQHIELDNTHFEIVVSIKTDTTADALSNSNMKVMTGDEGLLLMVDMTYDEESHNSYQVKNLISLVQNCRKEMKLNPWNKIALSYSAEHDDTTFVKLLTDHTEEINKKLGCSFVKSTTTAESKLFQFKKFSSADDLAILVSVQKIEEVTL